MFFGKYLPLNLVDYSMYMTILNMMYVTYFLVKNKGSKKSAKDLNVLWNKLKVSLFVNDEEMER